MPALMSQKNSPEQDAANREQRMNALKWLINNLTPAVVHEPTNMSGVDLSSLSDEDRLKLDPGLMDSESPLDAIGGAPFAKAGALKRLRNQA